MSEATQPPSQRPARAERSTTSCTECRRRKQKCNQGQPCSNCTRRFPPPVCEYRGNRRSSSTAISPQQPLPFILFPPQGDESFPTDSSRSPHRPPRYPSPHLDRWARRQVEDVGDISESWLGNFPLDRSPGSDAPTPYAWSTSKTSLSAGIIACDNECRSHSADVHAAVKMLRMYRSSPTQLDPESWSMDPNTWALSVGVPPAISGGFWPMTAPTPGMLGVVAPLTMQTSELLATYVRLISQFKASIDGNPDASNPYIRYYVPYTVQSPLLVNIAIYTAACFLTETGHIEPEAAMTHKGFAIKLLNDHIRSRSPPSDEGITGVIQLVVDEWLWGDSNSLHTHLRGLRELIRVKGGFRYLGLHGLISKLAITSDTAIALSFETPPFLRGGGDFEYRENISVPFRLALNTPFLSTLARFSSCDDALRIHPAVAAILDDMRFLLSTVQALPETASPKELQKVNTTSAWIYDRTSKLPAEGPIVRRLSAAASPVPSAPGSTPGFDARGTPETGEEQPAAPRNRQTSSRSQSRGQLPQGISMRGSLQPPGFEGQDPNDIPDTMGRQASPSGAPPDYIYQAVRLGALMYSRAVKLRRPFSAIITTDEFLHLWTTMWRVPLSTWRSLLGVFNWLLVPLVTCGKRPHDRFVKAMLNATLLQIGMDNWDIATKTMEGAVRLQQWLGSEPSDPRESNSPGEGSSRSAGWQASSSGSEDEDEMSGGYGVSPGRDPAGSRDKGKGLDVGSMRLS